MYQYGTLVSGFGGMSTLNPFYGGTSMASSNSWNSFLGTTNIGMYMNGGFRFLDIADEVT